MSWHYLQEQGEESSEACCTDGEPLPPLKSKTTHAEFCCNGKLTESYLDSLSGTMCEHSTVSLGEEKLMLSQVDFPARTFQSPEKAQESKENGLAYGAKWRELLVKYDRDTHSWKTHRCLWEEALPWSSVILPKWGMMQDGVCWERITSGLPTSASESGSWRTPCATDGTNGGPNARDSSGALHLTAQVNHWPTPRAGNPGSRPNGKGGKILAEEVAIAGGLRNRGEEMWPTPRSCSAPAGLTRQDGKSRMDQPPNAVAYGGTKTRQTWPTPGSGAVTGGPVGLAGGSGNRKKLYAMMGEEQGRKMGSGQLNPPWVEWLMGWPIGWTDLKPLATDKFRQWLHSHGKCWEGQPNE